jgi:hypothetical protein
LHYITPSAIIDAADAMLAFAAMTPLRLRRHCRHFIIFAAMILHFVFDTLSYFHYFDAIDAAISFRHDAMPPRRFIDAIISRLLPCRHAAITLPLLMLSLRFTPALIAAAIDAIATPPFHYAITLSILIPFSLLLMPLF